MHACSAQRPGLPKGCSWVLLQCAVLHPVSVPTLAYTPCLRTQIYVAFAPKTPNGPPDYQPIGTATLYFQSGRTLKITATLSCPWMMWSSPTDASTVSQPLGKGSSLSTRVTIAWLALLQFPNRGTGCTVRCGAVVMREPGCPAADPLAGDVSTFCRALTPTTLQPSGTVTTCRVAV
jgi:hypothetical protein